mmetsp:Transcript_19384/g.29742  ORF Transcript_19384/g.29742 Transcript_19384/m.29742 type:complete len:248 (-) Transcript_19384:2856-3599(-)
MVEKMMSEAEKKQDSASILEKLTLNNLEYIQKQLQNKKINRNFILREILIESRKLSHHNLSKNSAFVQKAEIDQLMVESKKKQIMLQMQTQLIEKFQPPPIKKRGTKKTANSLTKRLTQIPDEAFGLRRKLDEVSESSDDSHQELKKDRKSKTVVEKKRKPKQSSKMAKSTKTPFSALSPKSRSKVEDEMLPIKEDERENMGTIEHKLIVGDKKLVRPSSRSSACEKGSIQQTDTRLHETSSAYSRT